MRKWQLDRRLQYLNSHHARLSERLRRLQNRRLTTALVFFVGLVIAAIQPAWLLEVPLLLFFGVLFPIYVRATSRVRHHLEKVRLLREFTERQLARQNGHAPIIPQAASAADITDPREQALVSDLALLGTHSIMSLIDESFTDGGQNRLVSWLLKPDPTIEDVTKRQNLITRLSRSRWFLIRLSILARQTEMQVSSFQVLDFLRRPFLPLGASKIIFSVIALWTLVLVGMVLRLLIPNFPIALLYLCFLN